ncbi:Lrp/AsnC family transcriptional regulator [Clostridium thailandense]|uniref:Lrp/AsnC family transcriptional regulator n=1 Tax=Clostridium thailandense TaxID=2794346 RepID=UPI00398A477E
MDNIDKSIIKALEGNGRISHEDISKVIHISRPAIHQRVNKLEADGIIKGYRTIIDWEKLGEPIKTLLYVKISCENFKEIVNQILSLELPNVVIEECHRLAGEWCLLLKIRASTPTNISNFIDNLWKIKDIKETSTTLVLSTILENGIRK